MQRIRIDSLNDPRLDIYRDMKTSNASRDAGVFIAEGTTLVERLLHSSWDVESVLASEQKLRNFAARIPEGTLVYEVDRELATQLVGFKFHLGVVAAARRRAAPSLSDSVPSSGPSLVLVGEHLIDQENVGMLIRIGSAFGADAVAFSRGTTDPFSRRVLRVSMGNGLSLPIVDGLQGVDLVHELAALDFTCCATTLTPGAQTLSGFVFPERSAIFFGNETHGVSDQTIERCSHELTIPMLNHTDSLNVAVSAGIFAYSYRSQYS